MLEPVFDCRCFNIPREEVPNYFIWREQDAIRNSIAALGQSKFSHNTLHGKNTDQVQEMLFKEFNINWNDCTPRQKRGCYFQKIVTESPLSETELEELPPLHDARKNPNLVVKRTKIYELDMPILTKVINKDNVFFEGKSPVTDDRT